MQTNRILQACDMDEKKKSGKIVWQKNEIKTFLGFIKESGGYKILDSKRQRNSALYEEVSSRLKERGIERTSVQCRTKFKDLKKNYRACKTAAAKSGVFALYLFVKHHTNLLFDTFV